jgi:hypothetical protein
LSFVEEGCESKRLVRDSFRISRESPFPRQANRIWKRGLVSDLENFDSPHCEIERTREKSLPAKIAVACVREAKQAVTAGACAEAISNTNATTKSCSGQAGVVRVSAARRTPTLDIVVVIGNTNGIAKGTWNYNRLLCPSFRRSAQISSPGNCAESSAQKENSSDSDRCYFPRKCSLLCLESVPKP